MNPYSDPLYDVIHAKFEEIMKPHSSFRSDTGYEDPIDQAKWDGFFWAYDYCLGQLFARQKEE